MKKKNQKIKVRSKYRIRNEKGHFMSKAQISKKARSLGLTSQEVQLIFDRDKKQSDKARVPVSPSFMWKKAREIGEAKKAPQSFQIDHKQLIKAYLMQKRGQGFLNGSRISKTSLAQHISEYFQGFSMDVYMFLLNVTIDGNKIMVDLDEELHQLVDEARTLREEGEDVMNVSDKFNNEAFLSS